MGLLDKIQKLKQPESIVTIDAIRYKVIGLSGLDASLIATDAERVNKKRKNANQGRLSLDYFYLAKCVSECETDETLTAEQWAIVPRKHTAPLVVEVMKLNGLDNEDVERDPNESSTTET